MKLHFTGKLLLGILLVFILKPAHSQSIPAVCGTNDSASGATLRKYAMLKDLTRARTSAGEKLEYRLGLDINYATYLLYNGDREKLTKEAYRFVQAASDIFEREINVKLTVSFIHIWDTPEPYINREDFDYFNNVYSYWSDKRLDERDAMVGFSCRYGWFYGGSRMCTSNFPFPDNSYIDVDLLSHELGHTLGSPHTQSCFWPGGPIDRCVPIEGASPECPDGGYNEYVNGSIMSYCRSVLTFHPLCRNLMRDYAEGKIFSDFKLDALAEQPENVPAIILTTLNRGAVSSTPSFEWKAAFRADNYRFQTARDQAFTQIVEDTLVRQAYFQSRGLAEGRYFSRCRSENGISPAGWSETLSYTVLPFSESTLPPLISDVRLGRSGHLSGYIKPFEGITSYELELRDLADNSLQTRILIPSSTNFQSFTYPEKLDWFRSFAVRVRVQKNNVWGAWSPDSYTAPVWYNEIWTQNPAGKISASPILANVFDRRAQYNESVKSDFQIAIDSDFKNIVSADSTRSNEMNTWNTSKTIHRPLLEENKSYFVRSRIRWGDSSMTDWTTGQLTTGSRDQRFEFLGLVSPNLQTLQSAQNIFQPFHFYKSANKLLVHEWNSGYYETEDLKKWKAYIPSTTNGYSPAWISFFGTSKNGNVFLIDNQNKLVEQARPDYDYPRATEKFYHLRNGKLAVSEAEGIFTRTENTGVVRYFNGNWFYYDHRTLLTDRALMVTTGPDEQVWAVMEGGNVWKFYNNNWTQHSYVPNAHLLVGLTFDNDQNAYAYGEFGVLKFNASSSGWEAIPRLSSFPIRRIVFDRNNHLWAAAYQFSGIEMAYQAIIKYKDGNANVYSDGLNIFREPFDIEVFNDKVVLLTSGGELYTFDENAIQRFTPKAAYCGGNEITATITSNSSFSKDNQVFIALKNSHADTVVTYRASMQDNVVRFQIPDSLAAGTYTLQTITTNPAIRSKESESFAVYKPALATVTIEETNNSKAILKANEGEGLTYQWQRNGADIPGATSPVHSALLRGDYNVVVSNAGGCKTKSAAVTVTMEEPAEITLLQNTPNPVYSSTEISFYLPNAQEIELDLLNLRGQVMRRLEKGSMPSGWHLAKLDATNLPGGVYIYRLKAGSTTRTVKMVR